MSIRSAVDAALAACPPAESDKAVAALACHYADLLDDDETDSAKIGPSLLAALEALQMSPRARSLARKDGGNPSGTAVGSKMDELRARRARQNGAATVDASAS